MTDIYFFDTDCLSSFLLTNNETLLISMYDKRIVLTSFVYAEVSRRKDLLVKVNKLIDEGHLKIFEIMYGSNEHKEFVHLTSINYTGKVIGKGEASAIACVKCKGGILASNNFKDVSYYIDKYSLDYTTTSDILVDACKANIIDRHTANSIWNSMIIVGNYMPEKTFTDYCIKYYSGLL